MLTSSHDLAEKYALALFELAEEGDISNKVKEDIEALSGIFQENAEFKNFLDNPGISKAARVNAMKQFFAGKVEGVSLNIIMLLVEKRLESILPLIAKQFRSFLHEKEGMIEARVTTARELSNSEYETIAQRLGKKFAKPVVLEKRVDESIIGGIIIQIGDKLIDGSISQRLRKYEDLLCRINIEEKEVTGAL